MGEKKKIILTVSLFLIILSGTIYSSIISDRKSKNMNSENNKLYQGPELVTTEQIGRQVFDSYLSGYKDISKSETDRLSQFKIEKVEVKKEKIDKSEFVCVVKYDVRPFTNSKFNSWVDESGSYQDDWIKAKTCFLVVNKIDGEYKIIKNVTNLDLSSIDIPNKIKYIVLRFS